MPDIQREVDNSPAGTWNMIRTADGFYGFQAARHTGVYLTGASRGAALTLQNASGDGSQDWRLVQQARSRAELTRARYLPGLITAPRVGRTVQLDATMSHPDGADRPAPTTGRAYGLTPRGRAVDLGPVPFDRSGKGTVTLPKAFVPGTAFKVAVVFDEAPLIWDAAILR
ncbi:hypothetical protein RFN58_00890 [Streptomyces iakyrus]|uniref:hypothetical protein n=1 Tax=Streptomyces iakyrus TaxID=68219 RepID=UPI000526526F|nr:hypothetical protein [Streptomyces iakyrus]